MNIKGSILKLHTCVLEQQTLSYKYPERLSGGSMMDTLLTGTLSNKFEWSNELVRDKTNNLGF